MERENSHRLSEGILLEGNKLPKGERKNIHKPERCNDSQKTNLEDNRNKVKVSYNVENKKERKMDDKCVSSRVRGYRVLAELITGARDELNGAEALVTRLEQVEVQSDSQKFTNVDLYIDYLVREKLIKKIRLSLRPYYEQAIKSLGRTDIIQTDQFRRHFWERSSIRTESKIDLNDEEQVKELVDSFFSWLGGRYTPDSPYRKIELRCIDALHGNPVTESLDEPISSDDESSLSKADVYVPPTLSQLARMAQEETTDSVTEFIENDPSGKLTKIKKIGSGGSELTAQFLALLDLLNKDFHSRCSVDVGRKKPKDLPHEDIEAIRETFISRIKELEQKFNLNSEIVPRLNQCKGQKRLFTGAILVQVFQLAGDYDVTRLRKKYNKILKEHFKGYFDDDIEK